MRTRRYAPWLWLLTGLFAFRVVAQPAALVLGGGAILPGFEAWHGGVLPYPLLLVTQVIILGWLGATARRFSTLGVVPNRRLGLLLLTVGGVYFAAMAIRLLLGATVLREARWFGALLPAIFHLVLASYLLLYGHFHALGPKRAA